MNSKTYGFGKTTKSLTITINPEPEKVYLYVPYRYKDKAKEYGCKFDGVKKQWYVFIDNTNCDDLKKTFAKQNFNRSGDFSVYDKINQKIHKKILGEDNDKIEDENKNAVDNIVETLNNFPKKEKFSMNYLINIGKRKPLYLHPLFEYMTEKQQDEYNAQLDNREISKYI